MDDSRANPEEILKTIKSEEQGQGRGRLKIFYGYAAGVGKTYAMLSDAHEAKKLGVDVVIGYVEPHTRPETMALVEGLEQLPNKIINYNGIKLKEFDLDMAIRRNPEIILVDELAHTNSSACRHQKRYQDIEELLKAGIDVYTTVNVQHIESLNDMVAAITGVAVRERIPDHVFDNADKVKLVDIEPEELIERLKTGKIYKETQVKRAIGNFFEARNLVALREIALRRCADRANKTSEKARRTANSNYYTDEHILVCISDSPSNAKLIRAGARMATAYKGNFTALYVESSSSEDMDEEDKKILNQNTHLAEQLGATVETVYGDDTFLRIAEFARISGVSKIVLGRNNVTKKYFWKKSSLIEQLTTVAPTLDIYVITHEEEEKYNGRKGKKKSLKIQWSDMVKSVLVLAAATFVGVVFHELGLSESNIITIYILGVLITAIITTQRGYSLIFSIVSVLTFNFFFTVPTFTFNAYGAGYPVTFAVMFISAFMTSALTVKIKRNAKQAAAIAYRTKILFETNQLLQKGKEKNEIVSVTAKQLVKLLGKDITFYLAEEGVLLDPAVFTVNPGDPIEPYTVDKEMAVAAWVCKNNKHAGATTNTLGNAKCLYLAIRVNNKVYGVVGIALKREPLKSFENSVLLSILGECALALENDKAIMEREKTAILAKNEQLRANLLRSISHDLRTPLTSISGNAGILLASDDVMGREKKRELYTNIYDDSLWLINLVENLLSVTKIEDGTMQLHMNAELIEEVITEALRHVNPKKVEHKITVKQSEDFILARMDARLIVQVVINIVDNGIKYTQPGSEITIDTKKRDGKVIVEISDNGAGISNSAKKKVFDMFYTQREKIADSRRSFGLGLALCKSIITAHGGEISVLDNSPKGAMFRFTLPAEEVVLHE
ncbi:MAG: sensor histidine kinase KdpD [Anaerovoracaceae bacterium]